MRLLVDFFSSSSLMNHTPKAFVFESALFWKLVRADESKCFRKMQTRLHEVKPVRSWQGSNPGPSACGANALPYSWTTRVLKSKRAFVAEETPFTFRMVTGLHHLSLVIKGLRTLTQLRLSTLRIGIRAIGNLERFRKLVLVTRTWLWTKPTHCIFQRQMPPSPKNHAVLNLLKLDSWKENQNSPSTNQGVKWRTTNRMLS